MGLLVEGVWRDEWYDTSASGGKFERPATSYRDWIQNDGSTSYPAAAGRYHLYVSLACPWASRTVIFRKLKGLENAIGLTIVDPYRDEKGWAFRDPDRSRPGTLKDIDKFESTDPINRFHYLSEAYAATDPTYDGRVTVPALWDKETKKIVNNCEDDICPMFNNAFNVFAKNKDADFFPKEIEAEHAKLSELIYDNINNGVLQDRLRYSPAGLRNRVQETFRCARRNGKTVVEKPLLIWQSHRRSRLASLLHADSVRRRVSRTFQMQSSPDHRLPEPARLPARSLSAARNLRNR